MNDIFVSKIVGSPTETSWSQASSTGKLYIAISLFSENEKLGIIGKGKNVLEQIQREFFAIDNKNLMEVKNAVEKVFNPLEKISFSAAVGAIKDDILYIVTAGNAVVLIGRANNLAEVARGEEGEIIGFSGKLKHDDIIILETNEFNKKISNKLLAEYAGNHDNEKLAEDLAPFILENSKGEEAAIIIHFKDQNGLRTNAPEEMYYEALGQKDKPMEQIPETVDSNSYKIEPKTKIAFPNPVEFLSAKLKGFSRKQKGIFVFALLIVLLLLGSLFAERYMEKSRADLAVFESIFNVSSEKLENAKNLSSLNRGRALEEINSAIEIAESGLDKFKEGSKEYNQLNELLNELNSLRDELGGGSEIAGTSIFSAEDSEIIGSISQITLSKDNLIITGDKGYAVMSEGGDISSEKELDISGVKSAISNDTYLYLLGSNVNRITISNGNTSEIIEEAADAVDISYFGSNVYLLISGGEVKKYSGSSYQETNYLTGDTKINGTPISFAIDSSVYVLTDKGSIQKFTKGTPDSDFKLDSTLKISKNAFLYANENLDNIYLLDIDNASIAQIGTDGSVSKQFNALNLQNAKSFTVNNSESKAYAIIDNQVYSFDL